MTHLEFIQQVTRKGNGELQRIQDGRRGWGRDTLASQYAEVAAEYLDRAELAFNEKECEKYLGFAQVNASLAVLFQLSGN